MTKKKIKIKFKIKKITKIINFLYLNLNFFLEYNIN